MHYEADVSSAIVAATAASPVTILPRDLISFDLCP